jgi:hypothetical protein
VAASPPYITAGRQTAERIVALKRMLIAAACAIFIFGTACAREVTQSPTFILYGSTIIAARHVAQSNSAVGATGELCTTEYIPTRDDRGWYIRRSVDCEE